MTAKINFFPVGNGDMTLIETESGRKILIDMNIRAAADDPDEDTPDVAMKLRERLKRDDQGRLYIDVLLLSHPDKDHCTGLCKHFHLGTPAQWSSQSDKIFIRELWSSPMVFRRASKNHILCDDAKAFNSEARRRVEKFRDSNGLITEGDRILILGKDENGKTDDLDAILVCVNETFTRINGEHDWSMSARLLGPQPKEKDDEEEVLSKNQSSTILQFSLSGGNLSDKCRFLTGGDAGVAIWEKLWQKYCLQSNCLSYDILLTPHHCSWRSLSYDSWSEMGKGAKASEDARNALAQARDGATIVTSSKPIKDDDNDPPCIRAKREYVAIANEVKGTFQCVGEHPSEKSSDILEFEIDEHGPRLKTKLMASSSALSSGIIGKQPLAHG